MNRYLLLSFCVVLGLVGCGGSGGTANVAENSDAKAIADYEAAVAADQKAADEAEKASSN